MGRAITKTPPSRFSLCKWRHMPRGALESRRRGLRCEYRRMELGSLFTAFSACRREEALPWPSQRAVRSPKQLLVHLQRWRWTQRPSLYSDVLAGKAHRRKLGKSSVKFVPIGMTQINYEAIHMAVSHS